VLLSPGAASAGMPAGHQGRRDPAGLRSLWIRILPSNLWVTWAGG